MTKEYRVLVVDDAKNIHEDVKIYLGSNISDAENELANLKNRLRENHDNEMDSSVVYTIDDAYQGEDAIAMVETAEKKGNPYALIIMDIVMPPGIDGVQTIKRIWKSHPFIEVIIITAYTGYELKDIQKELGITDKLFYLHKPFHSVTFKQAVLTMVTKWDLDRVKRKQISDLKVEVLAQKKTGDTTALKNPEAFSHIITQNAEMINIFKRIEFYSKSPRCILITGETGTGKALIARAIHRISGRKGELVVFDVGKEETNFFNSSLFGHVKDAFNEAKHRPGSIVKAKGGVLFLDEIQNLSIECQNKLLGLIDTGTFQPLGSDNYIQSDARIIAGSNVNLIDYVDNGKFKDDLFERISAHILHIPPLRERKEDIPLLLNHFLDKASKENDKEKPAVSNELIALLSEYHFPGNVREFESMVSDAVCRNESRILSTDVFKERIAARTKKNTTSSAASETKKIITFPNPERMPTPDEAHDATYDEALRRANDNVKIAADMLGVTVQAVYKHIKHKNDKMQS